MSDADFSDLIERAQQALRPIEFGEHRLMGDVAAAMETTDGQVYVGVCIDTPSWGLCAERSAAAAMITEGSTTIRRVVAVWREHRPGRDEDLFVLPPCGHCRQFLLPTAHQRPESGLTHRRCSIRWCVCDPCRVRR